MFIATINSKGRVTIPIEIRNALGLDAGAQILFEEIQPGCYKFKPAEKLPVAALKGMFGKHSTSVSVAQMNAVVSARGLAALDKLDDFFDTYTKVKPKGRD